MSENQEVAVVKPADVPATISGTAVGLGGNITSQDLVLPRIVLTQAKSPTVEDGKHKQGILINSLTQEELKSGLITPVFAFKNYIRWKPRKEGGGILYKSTSVTPQVAEDLKWHGDEKPLCTAYINVVCVVDGEDMPLIASFAMTSYKAGQKLVTLIQLAGQAWRYKYALTPRKEVKNNNSYFVFDVARGAQTTPEEQAHAAALYEQVKSMASIETELEGDTTTPAVSTADNEDGL